jgi:hypothetical protein
MTLALLFKLWLLTQATQAPASHVHAALQAQNSAVSAELLLAQAHFESHWASNSISRIELGKGRATGLWPKEKSFPRYFRPPYFCGPSQLRRLTEKSCRQISRDLNASYLEARRHLEYWLKRCKSNLSCALAGYSGGNKYIKSRPSNARPWRYSRKVQRLANLYRAKQERLLTVLTARTKLPNMRYSLISKLTRKNPNKIDPLVDRYKQPTPRPWPEFFCKVSQSHHPDGPSVLLFHGATSAPTQDMAMAIGYLLLGEYGQWPELDSPKNALNQRNVEFHGRVK